MYSTPILLAATFASLTKLVICPASGPMVLLAGQLSGKNLEPAVHLILDLTHDYLSLCEGVLSLTVLETRLF
jgi:hypothetical protein